jgi:hypothetical protein
MLPRPISPIDNGNRGGHFRQPPFAVIGALTRKSFNTIGHLEDQMALERPCARISPRGLHAG